MIAENEATWNCVSAFKCFCGNVRSDPLFQCWSHANVRSHALAFFVSDIFRFVESNAPTINPTVRHPRTLFMQEYWFSSSFVVDFIRFLFVSIVVCFTSLQLNALQNIRRCVCDGCFHHHFQPFSFDNFCSCRTRSHFKQHKKRKNIKGKKKKREIVYRFTFSLCSSFAIKSLQHFTICWFLAFECAPVLIFAARASVSIKCRRTQCRIKREKKRRENKTEKNFENETSSPKTLKNKRRQCQMRIRLCERQQWRRQHYIIDADNFIWTAKGKGVKHFNEGTTSSNTFALCLVCTAIIKTQNKKRQKKIRLQNIYFIHIANDDDDESVRSRRVGANDDLKETQSSSSVRMQTILFVGFVRLVDFIVVDRRINAFSKCEFSNRRSSDANVNITSANKRKKVHSVPLHVFSYIKSY